MYSLLTEKRKNKGKLLNKTEILEIDGFFLGSKRKKFKIQGSNIREIKVINKKLAHPLVSKIVLDKYKHLISFLLEVLMNEDNDDGESCYLALNQIEKFRLQIKNKYRDYLKKKELEEMSQKLLLFQKEIKMKLFEFREEDEYQAETRRSR